jgi:predicted NBD/HSP70 family sugar kinase
MPCSRKASGLVWTGRYGCHITTVGNFEISVLWATHGGGYEIRFANQLAAKIEDLAEAKAAAVSLARKVLTEALDALPRE